MDIDTTLVPGPTTLPTAAFPELPGKDQLEVI